MASGSFNTGSQNDDVVNAKPPVPRTLKQSSVNETDDESVDLSGEEGVFVTEGPQGKVVVIKIGESGIKLTEELARRSVNLMSEYIRSNMDDVLIELGLLEPDNPEKMTQHELIEKQRTNYWRRMSAFRDMGYSVEGEGCISGVPIGFTEPVARFLTYRSLTHSGSSMQVYDNHLIRETVLWAIRELMEGHMSPQDVEERLGQSMREGSQNLEEGSNGSMKQI